MLYGLRYLTIIDLKVNETHDEMGDQGRGSSHEEQRYTAAWRELESKYQLPCDSTPVAVSSLMSSPERGLCRTRILEIRMAAKRRRVPAK
jgi:hypothetical protein